MQIVQMRSSGSRRPCVAGVFIEGGETQEQKHRDGHVTMGAETGVVQPQAKEHPQRWTNDLGQVASLLGADIPRDSRRLLPALMLQDLRGGVGRALEGGCPGSNPGSAPHQLGGPRHPCNLSTSQPPQLRNGRAGPRERSECEDQRWHEEPTRGSCLTPPPPSSASPSPSQGLRPGPHR